LVVAVFTIYEVNVNPILSVCFDGFVTAIVNMASDSRLILKGKSGHLMEKPFVNVQLFLYRSVFGASQRIQILSNPNKSNLDSRERERLLLGMRFPLFVNSV
jgi:hypothetical protein